MSQVTVRRPFGELDLGDQLGSRTEYGPRRPALRLIDGEFNRKAKRNAIEGRAGMTLASRTTLLGASLSNGGLGLPSHRIAENRAKYE